MALKKMRYSKKKVYVYDGKGAEKYSKLHLLRAFQEVLDRSYDVSFISPKEIIEGLWVKNAAVIAFGGGFDLGFKETLGSEGAKVIKKYVADGGKYLGICAGGYFASEHVEFDKNGPLEVCGRRELNFFQGICKGPVYPGFRYGSFKGSLAVSVELHLEDMESKLDILYHGGGCFLPGNDAVQDVACTSDFLEPSAKKRSQENLLLNQSFPGNQEKDYTFHPSISVLGFGITKAVDKSAENIFSHTTEEKAELIASLMDTLDVDRIDLLIACGAGSYPALRLITDKNITVKAFAFVNPWPHKRFRGITDNFDEMKRITELWDKPLFHPILRIAVQMFRKKLKIKFKSIDEAVKYFYTVKGISFSEIGGLLVNIDHINTPRMFIFSEKSDFIEPEILYDYLHLQGVETKEIVKIDSDGKIIQEGSSNSINKCVFVSTGSREIASQFSPVLNGLIVNFFKQVQDERKLL